RRNATSGEASEASEANEELSLKYDAIKSEQSCKPTSVETKEAEIYSSAKATDIILDCKKNNSSLNISKTDSEDDECKEAEVRDE
ncbi:hypothetical protein ACTXT7_017489, partial [Hymenolepis weldensis]